MSGLAQHAEVATRVVLNYHGNMPPALVILFESFDDRNLPSQGQVENIATLAGAQADAASGRYRHAPDFQLLEFRPFLEETPVQFVHGVPPMPRKVPCSFAN